LVVTGVVSIPLIGADGTVQGEVLPASRQLLREFVAGPENHLLQVVVDSLCGQGDLYSPLVIYGTSGVGKTLLARGLAERFRDQHDHDVVVKVITGADFARGYANALENRTIDDFRHECRTVDLFVLDDLTEMLTKRAAQQELCRTIDAIENNGGRLLVTTKQNPAAMSSLAAALRSRLTGGLVVPVSLPGAAARRVLVTRLGDAHGMELPQRSARILADGLAVSVPQLQGALLEIRALQQEGPITALSVRRYLALRDNHVRLTPRPIIAAVGKHFGVKVAELKSPSRRQALVAARGVTMHLIRKLTNASYQQVGRALGGRDHTTIIHSCRKTEQRIRQDRATRQAVETIENGLLGR
jgi:chromosomal replication initiator protein